MSGLKTGAEHYFVNISSFSRPLKTFLRSKGKKTSTKEEGNQQTRMPKEEP